MSSWPFPSFLNRDLIIYRDQLWYRKVLCMLPSAETWINTFKSICFDRQKKNLKMGKMVSSINATDKSVLTWTAMRSDLGL